MNVSFEGIGSQVMTFLNDPAALAVPGDPVCMSANAQVKQAPADSAFIGVCLSGDEEYTAVQLRGVVTCPYTGTAPKVGTASLAAAAEGKVTAKAGGREALVLSVDTAAQTVTFVL